MGGASAMRVDLEGPYRLTFDGIENAVRRKKFGVFALGYEGRGNIFYINYIGRSECDLKSSLLGFIGSDVAFKYQAVLSAEEAFWRECELFHSFRPPANRIHPGRPTGSNWVCPRCSLLSR